VKGMSFNTFIRAFFDTKYNEDEIFFDYKDKISSWIKIAVIFFIVIYFYLCFFQIKQLLDNRVSARGKPLYNI
jgi:hypothetical protein